jgi:hypothetical protein
MAARDVAPSVPIARADPGMPATPRIDSAQATQYVADSKMNVHDGQQATRHSRHVTS